MKLEPQLLLGPAALSDQLGLMLLVFGRDDRDRGPSRSSSPNVSSICPVPGASLRRWPAAGLCVAAAALRAIGG